MKQRKKIKTKKKKVSAKAARKRRAHVSLREFHRWLARGEKVFAPLLAGGGEISKGMRNGVRKGLVRLKGQTDRMVESWEKEMAAHLERRSK